jgi:AraC-like DNA-binding protein
MSDTSELGVLYTEHSGLRKGTCLGSLWSYETHPRGRNRRRIAQNPDGSYEYWLGRSDPLLNTIVPGVGVSLVINFGDVWAAGRSLATSGLVPRVSVVGPVTQARILRVGQSVRAIGMGVQPTLTEDLFGVPASELVDRIVPLEDLWTRDEVERLFDSLSCMEIHRCLSALRDGLLKRIGQPRGRETVEQKASELITLQSGRVSVEHLARSHGLSRREFARRFCATAGLRPKLFARITRFQALVHALLSTDVSQWASMSPAVGYYDQAHMINEFRAFAGASPTVFFTPQGDHIDPAMVQRRGRPSEWVWPMRRR